MSYAESNLSTYQGVESFVQNKIDSTYRSLSVLNLEENIEIFNKDIHANSFDSDKDIIIYSFLNSLGYQPIQRKIFFDNLHEDMRYRDQIGVQVRFWRANSVEDVLHIVEDEELGDDKSFYASLLTHLKNCNKIFNENNIHEEILSWSLFTNLRKKSTYKGVKELIDLGLPARHSLEVVING